MAGTTFEGFSLSHAAILDGATGAEETDGDIYGVNQGSIELDTDSYDNTGDDATLSTWNWFNFATITVQAGYVPFKTLALLAGSTLTSSVSGADFAYSLPLWNQGSINTSPRPMLIRVPSKDVTGVLRVMEFVLFRVQFSPFNFDGPTYKDGLKLNYTGRATMSSVDEKGAVLTDPAVGRLVNRPTS